MSDLALRRCSWAAQGAWLHVLHLLHTSDEHGVLRWKLAEVASTAGVPLKLVRELASKSVLKGGDAYSEQFEYAPSHAGTLGEPVVLVEGDGGSCWFSARMVRDHWRRQARGKGSRFTPDNQPSRSPTRRDGGATGDGPAFASAFASSSESTARTGVSEGEGELHARALRLVGFPECSGHAPDLVAAAREGISPQELVDVAKAHRGKALAYVVAAARGKRGDAANRAESAVALAPAIPPPDPEQLRAEAEARRRDDAVRTVWNDWRLGIITDPDVLGDRLEALGEQRPQPEPRRAVS